MGIAMALASTIPILILSMACAVYRRPPWPLAWVDAVVAVAGNALISTTS